VGAELDEPVMRQLGEDAPRLSRIGEQPPDVDAQATVGSCGCGATIATPQRR